MKVSEKWLREWVDSSMTTEELVARFTMAGLEVDSVAPVAGDFSGVIVGQVVSVAPHPDADKLRICQVAGHPSGVLQVVCGASNVQPGLKVPFALVGAVLPSKETGGEPVQIKAAKLRGVESNGMLCSATELGMESSQEGLLVLSAEATVGQDFRACMDLDDRILEFNVTPNRSDCLSVRGLAREMAVLVGTSLVEPAIPQVKPSISDTYTVDVLAPEQCPRYASRVIKGINNAVSVPLWLQERLRRSGIRSISPVVDITNYVLLELGQPMHAFDFNKLSGKVKVKGSNSGEQVSLLDGQSAILKEGVLLIADDNGPQALAGIMGCSPASASPVTTDILLEAAFFDPQSLSGKARELGLHTDSSHRFERGVDFSLQEKAIERATGLLLAIVGGRAGPVVVIEDRQKLPSISLIQLRLSRVEQYLGLTLSVDRIKSILGSLGIEAVSHTGNTITFMPPPWRFDVRIEVDLLEELARIYGYNHLPVRAPAISMILAQASEQALSVDSIKSILCSLGYREVITYSFVDPCIQGKIDLGDYAGTAILVQNPISTEMGVMRASLLPGLLATALYNQNRQQNRAFLFEAGLRFNNIDGKVRQEPVLGLLAYGARSPESWIKSGSQPIDFYDIKSTVEALLTCGQPTGEISFHQVAIPALHPGQSAEVRCNKASTGWFGALHPALQKDLGLDHQVFVAELSLEAIRIRGIPAYQELSRYPEVRRDLAFLVDRKLPVQVLCDATKTAAGSYLINLKVFDVYSGEGVDPQRKNVALGLTFQAKSRTLTDSEINENVERVVKALKAQFQADLRS